MKKRLVSSLSILFITVIINYYYDNVKAESYTLSEREWKQSFGLQNFSGDYGHDDYTIQPQPTGDAKIIGFRNDWNKAREFGVKPIAKGDRQIELKTYPRAIVQVFLGNTDTKNVELLQPIVNTPQKRENDETIPSTYKPKFTLAND
ncbi:secreted phage protein [Streptococcus equi subsp. equi]|uniref:Secreted phage protein n=2 Tax=Streptococcus equi TaxID=1336 RepID=A0A380JUL4_9STRE|nr:hypothetical protein [Streptococcus equi]SUN47666.1 secreted phage protein [Streptococcus equi subsp. equi]